MGDFQRDNRGGGFRGGNGGGGRPSFQKKSWGGSQGGRGDVTMHKAVCDECHKACEVPFRPSGDKPVYCSDCFGSKKGANDRGPRKDFGDRGPRRDFNDRPSPRPEFRPTPAGDDIVKKQLSEINNKLDRLLNVLEKKSEVKKEIPLAKAPSFNNVVKKVTIKKELKKKVVAKKKK